MFRPALIGILALGLMAGTASAQTKIDCGKAYKVAWDQLGPEKYRKTSAEQLAAMSRLALRAFDACQAGDEQNATLLFERVAAFITELGNESTGPRNPNQPSR